MEYFLFRHGETNWNVKAIIKSHMNDAGTHFTERGQDQIACMTELLRDAGVQAIIASDLYRTTQTARHIGDVLRVPLFTTDRLRGIDMGAFNGRPIEDFLQNEEVKNAFIDYDFPIPGGESINQLLDRLFGALRDIHRDYPYDRVLVITHGAAISNIVSHLNQTPYQELDYCYLRLVEDAFSVGLMGRYAELLDGSATVSLPGPEAAC